jgi:hypothetical protein
MASDPRRSAMNTKAEDFSVRFRLLLSCAGLLAGLALGEVGLRVVGFSRPSFYTSDPILGWTFRPGAEGWQREEGQAYVRINSEGFRDRDHAVAKPPGTVRIAVVGDSNTAAIQVAVDARFSSVLERELSRCPALRGKKPEVLNFGVDGYGTAQELLTLRYRVWKYSPDIVILCFTTGNDLRNNYRPLNEDPASLAEGIVNYCPYFVYNGDRLVLDNSFLNNSRLRPGAIWRHDLMADLMNRSRLLQLANTVADLGTVRSEQKEAQKRISQPGRKERAFGSGNSKASKLSNAVDQGEIGLDLLAYYPPQSEAWKQAWHVTEGLLVMTRDEVEEHGAEFWLMIASSGGQVNPDPAVRRRFMNYLGVDTLFYPDMRLQAFAEQQGIPVIALAPAFAAYAEEHHVYLHGFKNSHIGHWNDLGHGLAGEILASQLCTSIDR